MTITGFLRLAWELWNAERECGGEPGLILVEGAEGASPKGQGGSDMEDVQGTGAKEAGMGSCDAACVRESGAGNGDDADRARVDIPGKRKQDGLLLGSSQLFAENAPVERVDELEFGEVRGEERRLDALHDGRGSGRVGIGDVERKEEAGIRVDGQKRSRSAASCWAPETFKRFLPKVFF